MCQELGVIDLCWTDHENRQKARGLLPCGNRGGKLPYVSPLGAWLI